jgi:hypothetical protein
MSATSHNECTECTGLLHATLEASRAYYQLLEALESANIRNDIEDAFRHQAQMAAMILNRDNAIDVLRDHERTHLKKDVKDAERSTVMPA